MKNDIKRATWIVFYVLTASLFFTSAPMAGQAEKLVSVPKFEHYENKAIGFSIDYDTDKLTKEMGDFGSFVFRRASAEGMIPWDKCRALSIGYNSEGYGGPGFKCVANDDTQLPDS